MHQVQCVASQAKAVKAIIQNYNLAIIHLEHTEATNSETTVAQDRGILQEVITGHFISTTYSMMDLLP